jgi:hypothetical protein
MTALMFGMSMIIQSIAKWVAKVPSRRDPKLDIIFWPKNKQNEGKLSCFVNSYYSELSKNAKCQEPSDVFRNLIFIQKHQFRRTFFAINCFSALCVFTQCDNFC